MTKPESMIVMCYHCGNETPHNPIAEQTARLLYEEFDDRKFYEPFTFYVYGCGTCGGVTILGGFDQQLAYEGMDIPRLYPTGPSLLPPAHMISPHMPVPYRILQIYREIWPLRHKAPNAFAGQIRRALEYVCEDQNAKGRDLYHKLKDLSDRGILPETLTDMTTLIREVGNIGSHAGKEGVGTWDAELIDGLFRVVIEYVYIAPARIRRLQERLAAREEESDC